MTGTTLAGAQSALAAQQREGLVAICAKLSLSISAAQVDALLQYLSLLQRWNATYNLTAVRDAEAMLTQHLGDCLALVPALQRRLRGGSSPSGPAQTLRLLDVGSGGGLPGVVAAVLLPDVEVVCVDAVAKKSAFIQQVAGALPLRNLQARHARVEGMKAGGFQLITARAFASLAELCALTRRHLDPDGVWVAMKGHMPHAEIDALPATIEVFHVEPIQVPFLDAQRCLIWMRPRTPSTSSIAPKVAIF